MAIKISGSTIIDDSRNIVSAGIATATEYNITGSTNTLTASGLNVGVATATTLRVGTAVTISAGIVTANEYDITGSTNTFNASGISVGVITATSSVTIGSTDVLTAINAKASTGKAIAMAIVFG